MSAGYQLLPAVDVQVDHSARTATDLDHPHAPTGVQPLIRPRRRQPPGIDWWPLKMARELDDAITDAEEQRVGHRYVDLEDPGRRKPHACSRSTPRYALAAASRSLVRARNPGAATTYARTPGCQLSHPVRRYRRGILFCGHLVGTGACRGSNLHVVGSRPSSGCPARVALSSLNFGTYPTPLPELKVASKRAFYGETPLIA